MIEHHVVSLELAKKLKNAGFPQESEYSYYDRGLGGVVEVTISP